MIPPRKLFATILGLIMLAGCSGGELTGVHDGLLEAEPPLTAAAIVDVSGEWDWSNAEILKMPVPVALAVGVVPEGRYTHARCESAGTMTLFQTGTTFEGTAMRESNSCETKGGQPFQQPQSSFLITDGSIKGGSVHFTWSSPTVSPCPHHAVIKEVQGGVAVALSGTGLCILPGHPKSESPIDLDPPGDTTKSINWEAVRS